MRNAFVSALSQLAREDGRVVFLSADLGFKIFDQFALEFGGRFMDVGVAEATMIGTAAGLALGGMRPFVYSIAPFVTLRCLEQIRDDLCYHSLPVTIVGVGGGYSYGHNGATHHALEDIAVLRALPNMTVVCPGDPVEAAAAVRASLGLQGPMYLRLGRAGEPKVHENEEHFRIGEAITVVDGEDCSLIATGAILSVALDAAVRLRTAGVGCRVLSMHTVKPLDTLALERCARQGRLLVTLEEHGSIGGLAGAVSEWLAGSRFRAPLLALNAGDSFAHCTGSQEYLRNARGLSAVEVSRAILEALPNPFPCCNPDPSQS
jgi:transketolase